MQAAADGDTVTFDPSVFSTSQTINLASPLMVTKALTISGPGDELLTLKNIAADGRVMDIDPGGRSRFPSPA